MTPTLDPHTIPSPPSLGAQTAAQNFAGVTLALHGLALLVFIPRIWSRIIPVYLMQWDDWACITAYVFIILNTSLLLTAIPYTFTHSASTSTLADAQSAFRNATIAQPLWAWSMVLIKTSFALTLLRISPSARLRRFLHGIIAVQVALGVYTTFVTLFQCVPVRKAWDLLHVVDGRCWSTKATSISSITVAVVHICTDFVLALLPLSFLRRMKRPLRERVVVGVLMGLGVFAGVASILKIIAAVRFASKPDHTVQSINIAMWSVVEELVGFIVICVPCLRSACQRVREFCGVLGARVRQCTFSGNCTATFRDGGREARVKSQSQSRLATTRERDEEDGFKMEELSCAGKEGDVSWRRHASETGLEIWCTKEVVVEHGRVEGNERGHGAARAAWVDEGFDFDLGVTWRV